MSGAIVVIQQNRAMRRYREAGACSADRAATPEAVGVRASWSFRRMVSHGVFVEADDGAFYLDEDAAERFVRRRRVMAITVVSLGLLLALIVTLAAR